VLNASRHHRKNRSRNRLAADQLKIVLNASRHHRKNRSALRLSPPWLSRVLNASRHHRKNRDLPKDRARTSRSAQRLAASPEKSQLAKIATSSRIACSTPRGITGKIAPAHTLASSQTVCAQRLAASPEKSLKRADRRRARLFKVLYASRHHRKNRTRAISFKTRRSIVLNASRHHRKNRVAFCIVTLSFFECSTPRGITGKIACFLSS